MSVNDKGVEDKCWESHEEVQQVGRGGHEDWLAVLHSRELS